MHNTDTVKKDISTLRISLPTPYITHPYSHLPPIMWFRRRVRNKHGLLPSFAYNFRLHNRLKLRYPKHAWTQVDEYLVDFPPPLGPFVHLCYHQSFVEVFLQSPHLWFLTHTARRPTQQ